MPRIFISYRRDDSRAIAGRMHDRLELAFGDDNIFKDVDDIPPGSDFRQVLRHAIDECDVMLVVIGKSWLNTKGDDGSRRLENPDDFVRFEIETALKRHDMTLIPVLVDGAFMPSSDELPEPIRQLAYRNAVVVRHDPDFRRDVARLTEQLNKLMTGQISTVRQLGTDEPAPAIAQPVAAPSAVHSQVGIKSQATLNGRLIFGAAIAVLVIVGALVVFSLGGNEESPAADDEQSAEETIADEVADFGPRPEPGEPYPQGWGVGTYVEVTQGTTLKSDTQEENDDDPFVDQGTVLEIYQIDDDPFYAYEPEVGDYVDWWLVKWPETGDVGWVPLELLVKH